MSARTEKPSPRRLRDARRRGQLVRSAEVVGTLQGLVFLVWLSWCGVTLWHGCAALLAEVLDRSADMLPVRALEGFLQLATLTLLPLAGLLFAAVLLGNWLQTGPVLSPAALSGGAQRLDPVRNLARLLSWQSVFDLLRSLVRVVLLVAGAACVLAARLPDLLRMPACGALCALRAGLPLLQDILVVAVLCQAVLVLPDYLVNRAAVMKQLRMSRDELRREYRDDEGHPDMLRYRRERHRETGEGSLAATVGEAAVVVRNPSHLAVCLAYRAAEQSVPRVSATGQDARALHIVGLALRAGVPVVEDPVLARALMAGCPVGHHVPRALFGPVAALLRQVMMTDRVHDGGSDNRIVLHGKSSHETAAQ